MRSPRTPSTESRAGGASRASASGRTCTFGPNRRGRDFVVGDVHGCFRTLERALEAVEFEAVSDRLFGVGDLVNRGPHSAHAIDWLERRFAAVAFGNHERSVLSWFEAKRGVPPPAGSGWLRAIAPGAFGRWRAALRAMPLAITIETAHGSVGIVHADVPHLDWVVTTAMLEAGAPDHVDVALLGADAPEDEVRLHRSRSVHGLRALVHGHFVVEEVERFANRWNIDTGASFPHRDRLTLLHVNARRFRPRVFDLDERF